ncbi:hypothetical protein HDU85_002519 [Gaertneriomyces sp. JEL0708]|nr:hypothetical protein HDU85_002519 [Gaertneriomyces sp. JEL0708]
MVNQMNKVRKNLPKEHRAKRKGFKATSNRLPKAQIQVRNARLLKAAEEINAQLEVVAEENGGLTNAEMKKELVVVPGKLGKHNSIVKPRVLSKKKLRIFKRNEKFQQQNAAAKDGAMEMDMDEAPSGDAVGQTMTGRYPIADSVISTHQHI